MKKLFILRIFIYLTAVFYIWAQSFLLNLDIFVLVFIYPIILIYWIKTQLNSCFSAGLNQLDKMAPLVFTSMLLAFFLQQPYTVTASGELKFFETNMRLLLQIYFKNQEALFLKAVMYPWIPLEISNRDCFEEVAMKIYKFSFHWKGQAILTKLASEQFL